MTEYFISGATPAFVQEHQPFRTPTQQYPAQWLRHATPEQRGAIGAMPAPEHDPQTHRLVRDPDAGWVVQEKTEEEQAQALAAARTAALAEIDAEAGALRACYITVASGQQQTYLAKEAEARDHVSGGAGPWSFLDAEAAELGVSVATLAQEVIAAADAWRVTAARIEAVRRGAKARIAAAASLAEIRAVRAAVIWPS